MFKEINVQRMLLYVENTPKDIRLFSKSELDREFMLVMSNKDRLFCIDNAFNTSHRDALDDFNLNNPKIYSKCGMHVFNYRSIVNSFFKKECMIIKCYISMNLISLSASRGIIDRYLAEFDEKTKRIVLEIMNFISVPLNQYH